MSPVDIKASGREVVATGSFITYDESDTELTFEVKGRKYSIVIRFVSDPKAEKIVTAYELKDGRLHANFKNFDDSLGGVANTEPHDIGDSGGISGWIVYADKQNPFEIWKYTAPIITGALGFLFGKR